MQGDLTEEKGHCEDHPDINHLDVRSGGEGLRDSSETENVQCSLATKKTLRFARNKIYLMLMYTRSSS